MGEFSIFHWLIVVAVILLLFLATRLAMSSEEKIYPKNI
jgi:Sec-independent protein translocase protein TatA